MAGNIQKIIDIKVIGTDKIVTLEKAIKESENRLKSLTAAGKNNVGMQKIHAKNIAKVKVELKGLRGERVQEQKNLLANNNAAKQLDGSYNGLVQRNKDLLTKIKATKGGMQGNTKELQKMKDEYTKNNAELTKFDKTLGNNQRNVGNYGSSLGGAKEKLAAVGLAVGAAVVAFQAMSKIVGVATQDFATFESGFTNVLTLMSSEDISKFGDSMQAGAIDVMKEFGLQAEDMNTALFDVVSAGVPAGESIDFMREAANLALGGATDLTTAVDGMTSVMNAFGLETDEANQISAAFFSAQKFGKTTVSELSSSIGQVAPIAKQAGVSYQELMTAMALLTKQGLKTDLATTALKSTITAIMKPSDAAAKKFEELGINYGASGLQGEGLMNIMGQISAAAEEDVDALAELIPNVRALTGVGALGAEQLAEYDEMLKVVNGDYGENSSLAKAVAMQQETLGQKLNVVSSEWSAQKIALGEQLKPILVAVLDIISGLIANSGKLVAVIKGVTAGLVTYGVVQGALIAKDKLVLLATTAKTIAQGLYQKGLMASIVQVKALNAASKANVFLLIASAIIAIGTAMANWITEMSAAEKAQESLADAEKEAAKQTHEQTKQLEESLAIAQDVTKSDEDRQAAVDFLNQEVEGFNGTLTVANATTSEATEIVNAHSKALFETAKNAALAQKALDLENQSLDVQLSSTKQITKWNNKWAAGIQAAFSSKTYDQILEEKAIKIKAKKIAALDEEQKALEEHMTVVEDTVKVKEEVIKKDTKVYEKRVNNLSTLKKEVSELKKAQQDAVLGSKEFEEITIKLEQAQDLLKTTQDGLKNSTEETLTGFALLKDNVKKAQKALEDKIGAGEDASAETLALADANAALKIKEDELKLAVDGGVTSADKKIEKLKEAITQSEMQIKLTQDLGMEESDIHAAKIEHINAQIALELEKMNTQEGYYEQGVAAITGLRDEAVKLEEDAAANDWGGKLFGPKVIGAIQKTQKLMGASLGIMNKMNALANQKSKNIVDGLNEERDTALQTMEESAEFEKMTEEEKADALDAINIEYDEKVMAIEKEAFERNKKTQIAQALISGAMAVMNIAATVPKVDFGVMTAILIAAQIVMTGLQVAAISAQQFSGALGGMIPQIGRARMAGDIARKYGDGGVVKKFARGGMVHGNSHAQGGVKFNVGGRVMELEGGEAVINKRSTDMYRDELSAMNVAGGGQKFASGGLVMQQQARKDAANETRIGAEDLRLMAGLVNNQKINVTEAQISGVQNKVKVHEKRARY